MLDELEIKFTIDNVKFKWIGGESFLINTSKEIHYFPIKQSPKEILESRAMIIEALLKLIKNIIVK